MVISDLHLGEDIAVDASEQTRRDVQMASAAAADFIGNLTQRRVDGLPWRLVINGDLLDFLSVHVSPGDPRLAGVTQLGGLGRSDRLSHGCGRVPAASAIRVDMIAEHHPRFFRALARFIVAGNQLDIIAGNHDRELTEPVVAARLRAAVIAGGASEPVVTTNLHLHDWFVHEPGVAWIEHGHQYDEQCSFDHGLAPANGGGEMIANVDANSVRYLGSVAAVDPHSTEAWTFGGYFRFALSLGPRHMARLLGGYVRFVHGLWRASRTHRSLLARRRRAHKHDARIVALAAERNLPVATLKAIDGLRRMPITRTMSRVCRMLMVDRMALSALTLIAALVVGLWGGWPWGFAGGLATLIAGLGLGELISQKMERDPSRALATVPDRIHRLADVPLVVFGHTHLPQRVPLPGGGVYLNAGTWLPAIRPGLLRAFTHVVILRRPGAAIAELRQWRDGRSRPYEGELHDHVAVPAHVPHTTGKLVPAAAAAAAVAAAVTGAVVPPREPGREKTAAAESYADTTSSLR